MKENVIVVGPAFSQSGYGEHCRFVLRALLSRPDLWEVYLKPINWGNTSWLLPSDSDRPWIDMLVRKTVAYHQGGGSFDVSVQVTIPNEWQKYAPRNLGVTAGIETNHVAPQWIAKSQEVDRIVTISEHSRDAFLNTMYPGLEHDESGAATGESHEYRCTTPIDIVHYPVREYEAAEVPITLDYDFNYLAVAQWGPRKNLEKTIVWWMEEFKDEEVGLIVKTNLQKTSLIDRYHAKKRLEHLIAQEAPGDRKCKVYLLHGNMTPQEMTGLYRHPQVKCLISLSHGEGFGLPLFEAAYNELPIIAPKWSGHLDFLVAPLQTKKKGKKVVKQKTCFLGVDYDLNAIAPEVVWEGVLHQGTMWCYPRKDSYQQQLRAFYKNPTRYESRAKKLNTWIRDAFHVDKQYHKMCKSLSGLLRPVDKGLQNQYAKVVEYD